MKTLALAVSLSICLPLSARQHNDSQSGQRIHVEQTHVNLGTVYRGALTSHSFKVENRSDGLLRLRQVVLHCNCTSAAVEFGTPPERIEVDQHGLFPEGIKIQLEPGQSLDLIATVDSSGMPERRYSKGVDLLSDDPVQPNLPLKFDFTVMKAANVTPPRLEFGELQFGQEKSLTARLSLPPDLDLTFTGTTRQNRLTTALEKISQEGEPGDWRLTVTVGEDMPPGRFSTAIQVTTDHPHIKSVLVYVVGQLNSAILFEPGNQGARALEFGKVPLDTGKLGRIQIRNTQPDVPYRIERVEIRGSLAKQVKTRIQVLKEGTSFVVEVVLPPGLDAGQFTGEVVVHADHPTDRTRSVRFRGIVE